MKVITVRMHQKASFILIVLEKIRPTQSTLWCCGLILLPQISTFHCGLHFGKASLYRGASPGKRHCTEVVVQKSNSVLRWFSTKKSHCAEVVLQKVSLYWDGSSEKYHCVEMVLQKIVNVLRWLFRKVSLYWGGSSGKFHCIEVVLQISVTVLRWFISKVSVYLGGSSEKCPVLRWLFRKLSMYWGSSEKFHFIEVVLQKMSLYWGDSWGKCHGIEMVFPKIVNVLKWFFRKALLYLGCSVCQVDLLKSKEMLLQTTRTLTQGIVDGRPVGAVSYTHLTLPTRRTV